MIVGVSGFIVCVGLIAGVGGLIVRVSLFFSLLMMLLMTVFGKSLLLVNTISR